jgi:hypothetical protein
MCIFKQFTDIFGIPNKGIHSYRLLDVACIDYLLTLVTAFILAYYTSIPLVLTTIFSFIFAIICHALFGVNTSAIKYLGLICK